LKNSVEKPSDPGDLLFFIFCKTLRSGVIASRLKRVLKKLIDLDQTGFISGRYIGDNIRLIYDTE
jgi:hypothetical protein